LNQLKSQHWIVIKINMEAFEMEEYITIRMNGGKLKHPEELKIDQFSNMTLKDVLKQACEKFGDRS